MIQKCIKVALAGPSNAGKSTLINYIVGKKIAITSSKVQTTRFNTKGIINKEDTQIIFTDTPGIFKPKKTLEKTITKIARQEIYNADIICFIVDCNAHNVIDRADLAVLHIQNSKIPNILLLNKIDKIKDKNDLTPIINSFCNKLSPEEIFTTSGVSGEGLDLLIQYLKKRAKNCEWIFKNNEFTDIDIKKFTEEITRQHLFESLGKELPYETCVFTEHFEKKDSNNIEIHQLIYATRESHKKIIIGAQGKKIKSIGTASRKEMQELLGISKVNLFLKVKLNPEWMLHNLL